MSRDYLLDVLEKFAQVTSIIVETSKIKEDLDNKLANDENLTEILERTKTQVENLSEHATSVKNLFYKNYENIAKKLKTVNGKDVNENTSKESDSSVCDSNKTEDEVAGKTEKSPKKPIIKMVDINKLLEPRALIKQEPQKPVKHIHFDDTVVIITSSDEETPLAKTKTAPLKTTSKRKAAQETVKKTRLLLQMNSDSNSESSDDEVLPVRSSKIKNGRQKKELEKVTLDASSSLSDNSSSSSSDNESIKVSKKVKQKSKENNEEVADKDVECEIPEVEWKKDTKFNSQCYVKVIRVPCEKLKEYYLEKLELLEINKLRDITSLQRKRRRSSPETSSGSDNGKSKRKSVSKTAESTDSDDTDEDLTKDKTDATISNLDLDVTADLANDKGVEEMAEDALNILNSEREDANETPEEEEEHLETVDKNLEELKPAEEENVPSNSKDVEEKDSARAENISDNIEEQSEKDTEAVEKDNSDEKNNQSEKEESKSDQDSKSENGKVNSEKEKSDNEYKVSSNEDAEKKKDEDKSKKTWRKDKLLRLKLSSSDSEEEFEKFCKKKEKMQEEVVSDDEPKLPADKKKRKVKKRMKKRILSDSDSDSKKDSADHFEPESSSSSSESESGNEKEEESEKPKPRKRVKRVRDSSSDDDDEKSTRKQIRNIWGRDSLAETTKQAEAEEKERKARIAEKQKKYNQEYEGSSTQNAKVEKVVLDFDEKSNEELLRVDDRIVSKLKPHQASGIQFMWDACFESLERTKDTKGSGCILAHCMGLGKTLQVIALSHTLLVNSEKTNVKKVLVVSPLNTVLNWVSEYKQWLPDEDDFDIYELVSFKQNYERQYQVKTWHKNGGVLIIGYDMFRNLSNPENKRLSKKMRSIFQEALVDPGPDLIICDEGHLLKNEKTNLSIAMNRIKTLRRIVLTGTPLQNNLKEYFCMVQFIKPNLLGTYKEYLNRFVNPIINGQYTDSTPHDIQIMRKRSHVLHKMLDGVVQRRDYSVLQPYLPPKFEYVIFLKLSETQIKLYQHYMDKFARRSTDGSNRTSFLFVDFQALQRICTHPRVLLDKSIEMKLAKEKREEDDESEGSLKDFINDDDEDESTASSNSSSEDEKEGGEKNAARKRVTRAAAALAKENGESDDEVVIEEVSVEKEWWQEYCDGKELDVIAHSSKLFLLFEILKECEQIGDKVLVFSQSLYSLNCIEYFIGKIHDATQAGETESVGGYSGSWCLGLDYFRLDGSSSCDNRSAWCKTFNNPSNTRARLFLISTRAGGLGINLVAANRVIIFDVSWNPSHDVQSIYRVYRFGQTKPCYIYRFVTQGTMEMKIYERQVTKQAISKRVIDEQQIDRHYNQNDLAELYKFEPDPGERPTPLVPKDVLLGELLQKFEDRIYKYHEHQSLLENKEEEGLNEEERKAAWEEFENEKKQRNTWGNAYMRTNNIELALANIVRKENPSWTEVQIRTLIPTLNAQLQEQIAQGDLTLYRRVQREIQLIQTFQAQKLREQFYQQQLLQRMQQQQQQQFADKQLSAQLADAMKYRNAESWLNHYMNPDQMPGTSHAQAAAALNPSDIIDLND